MVGMNPSCYGCTWEATKHEGLFNNIDVTVFTELHSNGFIVASACIHNMLEHADDLSKLLG